MNILRNKRKTVRKHFPRTLQKYLKEDEHNSLHLAENILEYLSLRDPETLAEEKLNLFKLMN